MVPAKATRFTTSPGYAESLDASRAPRAMPPSTSDRVVRKRRSPFVKCWAKLVTARRPVSGSTPRTTTPSA